MAYEVYQGRDNEIAIILDENGSALDISGATGMKLRIGKTLIESTNGATSLIRWNSTAYATGEVHIFLGSATALPVHTFRAPLTVYDPVSTRGVCWGKVHLDIRSDPEAT
jgi:hypothetical protein